MSMLGKGRVAGGVAFGLLVMVLLFRAATQRETAAVPPEAATGVVVLEEDCDCSWVDSIACTLNDGGECWMTCCGEWEEDAGDGAGVPDRDLVSPEEGDANWGVVALGAGAVPPEAATGVVALEEDCDCSWVDSIACSLNDGGDCWMTCCGEGEGDAGDRAGEPGPGTGEDVAVPPEVATRVVALGVDCDCSWVDSIACTLNDGGDCWMTCCGEGEGESGDGAGERDPGTNEAGAPPPAEGETSPDAGQPNPGVPGESLFCFAVVQSSSYEPDVMRRALARQAGIFACDTYALFSVEPFELAPGIKAIQFDEADVGVSEDKTAANTQLFLNVWDKVQANGQHRDAEWTVKVDPDCVFLPWKLKPKLMQHNGKHAFVRNCNAWPDSDKFPCMFGALEILSRSAVDAFLEGKDQCQNLPMSQWSEDLFITKCLDQLGVSPIDDESVLSDGLCTQSLDPPSQRPPPDSCTRDGVSAFHPFKDADSWDVCLDQAMAAQ